MKPKRHASDQSKCDTVWFVFVEIETERRTGRRKIRNSPSAGIQQSIRRTGPNGAVFLERRTTIAAFRLHPGGCPGFAWQSQTGPLPLLRKRELWPKASAQR